MKKLFITAALLVSVFTAFASGMREVVNETYLPAQVKKIEVNFASGKATFKTSHSNQIQVVILGEEGGTIPTVAVSAGTLSIKTKLLSNFKKKHEIQITVPSGIEFENISLITASAAVGFDGIRSDSVDLTTTSGTVNMKNCDFAKYMKINGASGKISLSDIKTKGLTTSAVSGEVSLSNTRSDFIRIEAVSGKINCEKTDTGMFEIQCVSGKIDLDLVKMVSSDSFAKNTSGTISLTVPKNSAYSAKINTTTGNFTDGITGISASNCDDLISSNKKGGPTLKLSSLSGNISISSR